MSDQNELRIAVQIGNRSSMESPTSPSVGPWTYHHVLPVRLYFMIAWTLLRVAKHPDSWQSTRRVSRASLKMMCQNRANGQTIERFLDTLHPAPSDEDIQSLAKLCTSPNGGGFGGPHSSQRIDDPGENLERYPPISAPTLWYATLRTLDEILRDIYALRGLPAPHSTVEATHKVMDWCAAAEGMAGCIRALNEVGTPRMVYTDWALQSGQAWTLLTGQTAPSRPTVAIRLRKRHEPVTYRADTPADPLPADGQTLQRQRDYIRVPPAPPA